jgi:hypothetical protein
MSTSQPTLHFAEKAKSQSAAQRFPRETAMTDYAPTYASSRMQSREKQKRLCRRMVQLTCVFFVPFVLLRRFTTTAEEKAGNQLSILAEARADASA